MDTLKEFLDTIEDEAQREKLKGIFEWVLAEFPQLETRIAWNMPMFTDHETFILAFSTAKKHIAMSPETKTIQKFDKEIKEAGYDATKMMVRIPWKAEIDYDLIKKMIAYNIEDKKDMTTFWRKPE